MANACWCKGEVLAKLFALDDHDCCRLRKKNAILCKTCYELLSFKKLQDLANDMACDEVLMYHMNRIDNECNDIMTYKTRIDEITEQMTYAFANVQQDMADRAHRQDHHAVECVRSVGVQFVPGHHAFEASSSV